MSLKIGFFGSAPFVTEFLKSIFNSEHKISFIVTAPDKPKGRGKVITPPEAKVFAMENKIPCLQPENVTETGFIDNLRSFGADLFLVIAYGKKLPAGLLYMPPLHSYNLHFSLLPRWRGAAPVNWAIISGDKVTGLTFMKMDEGLDTGDILFQESMDIDENETSEQLFFRLINRGKQFLLNSLISLENKDFFLKKQDESLATYARTFTKDDGLINWEKPAGEIHNKIRGLLPWPSAFTFLNGKRLKVLKSSLFEAKDSAGKIIKIDKDGIIVAAGEGALKIIELQEEGKNKVLAADYARGKTHILNSFFDGYGSL